MNIKAKICVMNPVMEGISKASGAAWKRQDLVLGWQEPYGNEGRTREQLLLVTLHGDHVDRLAASGWQVGDIFEGEVSFGTRSYGDRVYSDIAAFLPKIL